MVGRKLHGLGSRSFRYGELERALGVMLDAGKEGLGALRGRLKRLSTLGIPGDGAGKGSRRRYSWEECCLLAIALLLEDAGLDPVVVAAALKNVWPQLARRALAAIEASTDNPMMLMISELEAIAGPWRTGDPLTSRPFWISVTPQMDERAKARRVALWRKHYANAIRVDPSVNTLIDELAKHQAYDLVMKQDRNNRGWLLARNLTDRLNVLRTALEQKGASRGRSQA
jgi:hypothetical protein